MGWRIFHRAGLAFCCRSRLSSNVRRRKFHFPYAAAMNPIQVDLQFDELLQVGVGSDPSYVGVQVSTRNAEKQTFAFTIPSDQLPTYVAKLTTAAARTAQLEAQRRGANATAVQVAEERYAFQVESAGLATPRPERGTIVVFLATSEMAVLPVELKREAAQALFSSLADFLAS